MCQFATAKEFNLLQAALNIEENMEDLRYNNIVIATDADVDGMHIRLLLITFFLQFFPELIKEGHLYILQTPLFRVRNKKETFYCYSEKERINAIEKFYDTIIANGNIEFTILESIPCADECANYAEIVNFVGEIRIETKMIVIYRVNSDDKIVSLRAFWDYQKMEEQLNALF